MLRLIAFSAHFFIVSHFVIFTTSQEVSLLFILSKSFHSCCIFRTVSDLPHLLHVLLLSRDFVFFRMVLIFSVIVARFYFS